ncbi:hypothetical protein [Gordonia araii]|nr:hypothetical protein [Gordonia araii]
MTALAAVTAALVVVPAGTAGASPKPAIHTANFTVSAASDAQAVTVTVRDGAFRQTGRALEIVNAAGKVADRIPLVVETASGNVPLRSAVAANGKSAEIEPLLKPHRHQVSRAKDKAWNRMMAQLNKDWPCAAGYVGGGALIGFLVGLLTIVGWPIGIAVGAAAGAYVGYTTCNRGAGWRAAVAWWNTP